MLGHRVDHRRLWRAAQKAGLRVREDLEGRRHELFELGVAPDAGGPHRMVVVEADGPMIRLAQIVSRRRVITQGEVKLAIWYAGKGPPAAGDAGGQGRLCIHAGQRPLRPGRSA